jgi:hypothetical protein
LALSFVSRGFFSSSKTGQENVMLSEFGAQKARSSKKIFIFFNSDSIYTG